jgi:hypothetical protein
MPPRFLCLLLLATALALAVVWQNAALRQEGRRLESLRAELAEERAEQLTYRAHLSKLSSPQRILRLVQWLGLDLSERVVRPADEPPAQRHQTNGPVAAPVPQSERTKPAAAVAREGQPAAVRPKPSVAARPTQAVAARPSQPVTAKPSQPVAAHRAPAASAPRPAQEASARSETAHE